MKRVLAGLGALVAVFALAGCSITPGGSDVNIEPSDMFVKVLNPPYLPIMHMRSVVQVVATPQKFEAQVFLWQWTTRSHFDLVRTWKRFKGELPAPGHEKKFYFPDLRLGGPNDEADDLLVCAAGAYFEQFHIFGYDSQGHKQDVHGYFPYLIRKGLPKYAQHATRRGSWQVTCDKTRQIPDPPGEKTPSLTFGKHGWKLVI